ncbi:hypothetical protein KUL118_13700 [Tenacibaculum sp. KUL118]|uniref:DUF5689 domain-containing protein n=1 Tax=Tenacibaculum sp. XPcli2-G TaxID=2954503 RepID=UPI0012E62661|nr:DUF5689 domain-containing protein [Tenacibaculum sp. XPcli2-G]MCO7184436.1 DUF5689 domain-containing protein [Tenacibaculum sp. XPcli2-G]GFD78508.1 hypothetical protein KUL118_13700 [Tenacibaculum sp. KUL118]
MKKINLYKIFAILFIAISASCVDNNDFELPTIGPDKQYENLKSLDEVIAQYNGNIVEFNDDTTIFGYVVSDDREGNFYKELVIQDKPENPTVGVVIKIDDANLGARYNIGRKIYVKLKGLALSKPYSAFEIGIKGTGNRTDRISANDYISKIDRSSEIVDIIPTTLTIGELTENHINTLVKIENLQSETKGLQYAYPEDNSYITRTMTSCETFEKIDISTSKFVSFKEYYIPDNKGSITAILDEFAGNYQLILRNTNDINFTDEYGCNAPPIDATLNEIKAFYKGSGEATITKNLKIKVVITSDLAAGNLHPLSAFAQDATAGIALRFSGDHNLNLGDEVEIAVGGTKLSEYNDLLQLNISPSSIIKSTAGTLPTPETITFAQALTGDYESKLVQINGVQFKDNTKIYNGNNELITECDGTPLTTYVRKEATFANNNVNDKKGAITGIMTVFEGTPQIYLRNETDLNFTEDYVTCGGTTTNAIFFSELADPNNNANARFIELYNSGTDPIDLTGWTIRRYTNDATSSTSSIDLSGKTIAGTSTFVIAKNAAELSSIYGVTADMESTSAAADSNGDDQLELVDPSGTVIDIFGVIGEDGSGTNHEFEDGRAYRKASVTQGNPTYTFAEWDIWNDTGDAGTTNAPQDAPGAFTPGVR